MRTVLANRGRGGHTFGWQAVAQMTPDADASRSDFLRAPGTLLRLQGLVFSKRSHAVRVSREYNEDSK